MLTFAYQLKIQITPEADGNGIFAVFMLKQKYWTNLQFDLMMVQDENSKDH